jgi:hypothetical protein
MVDKGWRFNGGTTMRRAVFFAFLAALTISTAHAQESPALPDWDARAHCERQQRIIASESAVMLRMCLDNEDNALKILRQQWDQATPAARRTCLRQQQTLRTASYFMLNMCVEMEAGATRDLQRR